MEKFELTILGCGSALPTTRHNPSSQVLDIRQKLYMIDCGEGAQLQLRRSHLRFTKIDHIFISHMHGDHCFGLMPLVSTYGLLGRTAPLYIHAPESFGPMLATETDYYCRELPYEVKFCPIDTSKHTLIHSDNCVEVYALPLRHRIACCGFLFREKPSLPHIRRDMIDFYRIPLSQINRIKLGEDGITPNGEAIPADRLTTPALPPRSYAYCSDTMYQLALAQRIEGVDLLFHEATFLHNMLPMAQQTFHSTALQAATIATACHAKRLCIGHYSSRYTDEQPLLEEARSIFPNTILAQEGLTISL